MNETPPAKSDTNATRHAERQGRILTDTIYGAWCDICDEHLDDFPTYQEASIRLTTHLDSIHGALNK